MNMLIFINTILNTCIMYFFLDLILKRNNKNKYFMILYLVLFFIIKIFLINYSLGFKHTINTIISLIYLSLFYKNKIVMKIISYCIYAYLEMSIYLFLIIINLNSLKLSSFNGVYYCNPKYILIEKIILLIVLLIVTYKKNKNLKLSKKYSFCIISIVSIVMLILVSIIFVFMLKDNYYETKPKVMIILMLILITLVIIMTYILKLLYILKKEPINNEYKNHNVVNFNNSTIDDKHIKYVVHDIKNHIQNINVLIENKKYNEATRYSNEMYNLVKGIEMTIKTGNILLDAIINNKLYLAKKEGIEVTFNIKVPNKININPNDLSVILDNILDNAIEANKRIVNNSKKNIDIDIKYNLGYLFMKVTNSYNGIIKCDADNKKFISSKRNEDMQGIGLEDINKVVSSYSGEVKIDYDKSQFSISILLNL